MENNQSSIFEGLSISPALKENMESVAKWAKICAIIAFITQGLQLFTAFKNNSILGELIGTAITVFLNVLLLNFANKLSQALSTADEGLLTESFSNLRRYYLITFILMIIVASFVTLALLIVGFTGSIPFAR